MTKSVYLCSLLLGTLLAAPSYADRSTLSAEKKKECDNVINDIPGAYNRRKALVESLKSQLKDKKYFDKHLAVFKRVNETMSKSKDQLQQELSALEKKSPLSKEDNARVNALKAAIALPDLFEQLLPLLNKRIQAGTKDPKNPQFLNKEDKAKLDELSKKIDAFHDPIEADAELAVGMNQDTPLDVDPLTTHIYSKVTKGKDGKEMTENRVAIKGESEDKPRDGEKLEVEVKPVVRPTMVFENSLDLEKKGDRYVPVKPHSYHINVKSCSTFSSGRVRGMPELGKWRVLCSRYNIKTKDVLMGGDFDSAFNNIDNPYMDLTLDQFTERAVGLANLDGEETPGGCIDYWKANFAKKESQPAAATSAKVDDSRTPPETRSTASAPSAKPASSGAPSAPAKK